VAGNVADVDEVGTIEYGAGHLHSPLVVVLGHTKCGAVTAVVNGAKVSPNIAGLVDNIAPAVEQTKHSHPDLTGDALVASATEANVMQSIRDLLRSSEEMRHLVAEGRIRVVGAVYDLHNGTIQWLGEHPKQAELLKGAAAGSHATDPHGSHNSPHSAGPQAARAAPAGHAGNTGHDSTAAHGELHESHDAAANHRPTSNAAEPSMPHESGTLAGMLIPAAFLGGAGLVSTSIFFRMKNRAAPESPAPGQPN
jgi:carbonic anhydrase